MKQLTIATIFAIGAAVLVSCDRAANNVNTTASNTSANSMSNNMPNMGNHDMSNMSNHDMAMMDQMPTSAPGAANQPMTFNSLTR